MAKRRANGEGSIYKRSDGTWCAQYTDYTGKKRYLYAKTQQAVKDKLKEAIKNKDLGILADAGKITFSTWMKEWLETYARPGIRANTYAAYYATIYTHIIPAFEDVKLKDLREDMLQRFINDLATTRKDGKPGGYKYGTCRRITARIYSALEKAVDLGMILKNPAKSLRLSPNDAKEKEILTKDEQARLEKAIVNSLTKDHNNVMFLLALYTGLRVGEIAGLCIKNIDLEKKELYVRQAMGRVQIPNEGTAPRVVDAPKTPSSIRTVPLPQFMVDRLKTFLMKREELINLLSEVWERDPLYSPKWFQGGFLFLSVHGNALEPSGIAKKLKTLTMEAGVKNIGPHTLRHTFATRWLEAGYDVKSLSKILGHKDAKMTLNIYVHSLPEQQRSSMEDFASTLWDE